MAAISWRTGVNLREFAYYGPEFLEHTQVELQNRQLAVLKEMGVKLIRFFACHQACSPEASIERTRQALDLIDAHDMQAIVCLDDSVAPQFAVPRTDPNFPRTEKGHLDKRYWHQRQFLNDYLPHITPIVRALADHPALLIWELGNEYAIHPRPYEPADGQAFTTFVRLLSDRIKRLAPTKLVSTGLVNSRQVGPEINWEAFARELYEIETVDVISIHYYDDDNEKANADTDVNIATALEKPFYIGEVGALANEKDGKENRPEYYRREIQEWKDKGAFTVLPWAFDASGGDVGVSDTKSLASIFHDFEALKAVVHSFAAEVQRVSLMPWIPPEQRVPSQAQINASAMSATDRQAERMTTERLVETAKPTIKHFKVVSLDGVNIRKAPSVLAEKNGRFDPNTLITVDVNSRTEAEDWIWWQHQAGWSVERNTVTGEVVMEEVQPEQPIAAQPRISASAMSAADRQAERMTTEPLAETAKPTPKHFKVVSLDGVNIRKSPSVLAEKNGRFDPNTLITVDANSRTEAEDWIWWQHQAGWSVERNTVTGEVVMEEVQLFSPSENGSASVNNGASLPTPITILQFPTDAGEPLDVNALPLRDQLFQRLPIDPELLSWVQHFGSTRFAYSKMKKGLTDYHYSQGLHAGIDLANSDPEKFVPVFAGFNALGIVDAVDTRFYRPRFVRVIVGDYMIIYGHLHDQDDSALPRLPQKGDIISGDTILGKIATPSRLKALGLDFSPHLHLEIRHLPSKPDAILNPLLFFPDAVRQVLVNKRTEFYQNPPGWTQWGDALSQPVLRLQVATPERPIELISPFTKGF